MGYGIAAGLIAGLIALLIWMQSDSGVSYGSTDMNVMNVDENLTTDMNMMNVDENLTTDMNAF